MQIKISIFIPICCAIFANIAMADINCSEQAMKANQNYFDTNAHKQIDDQKLKSLNKEQQQEAKIRNLCFRASMGWHFFCELANCKAIPKTQKVFGHPVSDVCSWSEIDCFSASIEKIVSVMQDSNDYVSDMFFTDKK